MCKSLNCWKSDLSLLEGDLDGTSNICLLSEICETKECLNVPAPQITTHSTCNHFSTATDRKSCCSSSAPLEIIESSRNALRGMFDKCASCAQAWERVACAMACSPKQGNFIKASVAYQEERMKNVSYVLSIHESLAKQLW
jgi:hypothetical protein